ncbi:MAG TPA: hypothetical protein VFG23_22605 [Polyangia bacterium]|nr:hypothetical protein [Polyangia bacterium]
MELTPQRGAIAIQLDRPRVLFFDMNATWLLIQKYGHSFIPELYTLTGEITDDPRSRSLQLKSMDALAYFLWAGLQADAKQHGEEFTLEQATEQLRPFTYTKIFNAVVVALVGGTLTPAAPGKTEAEPARPARPATKGPGPTRVSTSLKRSAGPSGSRAGRRNTSGSPHRGS